MATYETPSPILRYLVDALAEALPEADYDRLTSHDEAIAATTSQGDTRRALRCADWAVELAGEIEKDGGHHPLRRLGEVLHQARQAGAALEIGIMTKLPGVHAPDVETVEWIDDVVAVAKEVAERSGWVAVPWEDLIVELVEVEPEEAG